MAEDVRHFTVTCPAATPIAAPQTTGLAMPPRIVRRIDWRVPPGPMGTMGFLIAMGSVPVLPTAGVVLFVAVDDKDGYWELSSYPDSGSWQCLMYNTGANPHSVNLTFHTDLPARPVQLAPALAAWEIGPSGDLSRAGPPVAGRLWLSCQPSR